jgi:hypothetical protein
VINHPDHLYCVHIHRWHVDRWCPRCRRHWEEHCGQIHCPNYEQLADADLARAICLEMENGNVPVPAEFANLDLGDPTNRVPVPSDN